MPVVSVQIKEKGRTWKLEDDLQGEVTMGQLLQFTKQSLIILSDVALKEEQARGFPQKPILVVDNVRNKPIDQVNPLGKIEFLAPVSSIKVIRDAYKEILYTSKVVTGTYYDLNWVYYNGVLIATKMSELDNWLKNPPVPSYKDRVRFVNVAPYAARLERLGVSIGKTKPLKKKSKKNKFGKGQYTTTTANGAYMLASRKIRSSIKNLSDVRFEFKFGDVIDAPAVRLPQGIGRTTYKGGKLQGMRYLYPTILISLYDVGLSNSNYNTKGTLQ